MRLWGGKVYKTGKVAPEHKRLNRYSTMSLDEIKFLPVSSHHLSHYLGDERQEWLVKRKAHDDGTDA